MLDHHLQRSIVYRLAFSPELRFSELKPDTVENKLFTYHLKKVVAAKLVEKRPDGSYALTIEGRRLGTRVLDKQRALVDRPESVLFLAIRRPSDNAWLLYRRKTHPLIDKVGFMHCTPRADEPTEITASTECLAKTGVKATFRALGGGYFRVFNGAELESFTHFTLLVSDDATGDLQQADKFAEYFWAATPDFTASEMLPNMLVLGEAVAANVPIFIERTFAL